VITIAWNAQTLSNKLHWLLVCAEGAAMSLMDHSALPLAFTDGGFDPQPRLAASSNMPAVRGTPDGHGTRPAPPNDHLGSGVCSVACAHRGIATTD
jgi:hypothetical protein